MSEENAKRFANWLKPHEALAKLEGAYSSKSVAVDTMLEWLRGGMMTSLAMYITVEDRGELKGNDVSTIEAKAWNSFREVNWNSAFWKNGTISHSWRGRDLNERVVKRYFDVRFDPNDIQKILDIAPSHVPTPPEHANADNRRGEKTKSPQARNKGGRPSKPWWQEFWVEMCRLIHTGDIHPTQTQADIQRVMEQWVSDHDHEAGPTVMKEAARKLHKALRD